jgi:hypothetical protein
MAVLEWSEVSSSRVDTTPRRSVNEPAAELMRPWSARPRKELLARAVLRQAAKQQNGREDKGCADPEELRTDDSSWRHRGGRLVRLAHQGGKVRSTGRIARCVVLWLWNPPVCRW